ncbi:PREDICTED: VHS domain-containing protein At3g16270 isoform X2 [Nelumbo nucifera]|uniref:VHS domain-containing protein At3g16270 isoform X2 n=1 Tax=Nelumbo nucifera TaxID=4432 RepID=A0A1U7Z873_NELNU|nr:PREDICTED: VHS domain-containing protein At3g16270 isoform X2 [Nelumbo nucifera]
MDSSRQAVESYWRSRMIDGATSDEDKVTPVYKLEEICELLRSSHVSIVKEVSEFILKRLEHKSPIVKQKALRLIKYAVVKSGVEFRREMQRHSVAVRQLFHYKGQLDPLKGDALNKAVRDTAHEAISAIFAAEDSKPAPAEELTKRIQGFGNTNFEMPSEEKKSFLSEVVGLGSASIKQGLSTLTGAHSLKKNDSGSYKSPTLRRSLTTDIDNSDRYEGIEPHSQTKGFSGISSEGAGTWGQDSRENMMATTNGDSNSSYSGNKSREEKLLETIVTSSGVRLQPTRDAIQTFLVEASKLDAMALSHALELKLQSHLWQVLSLLNGDQTVGVNFPEKQSIVEAKTTTVVQLPDLIDTGDSSDYYGKEDSTQKQSDQSVVDLMKSATPTIVDLLGDSLDAEAGTNGQNNEEDPFADVSFHTTEDQEHVNDLFSGLAVDDKQAAAEVHVPANKNGAPLLDIFGPISDQLLPENKNDRKNSDDLMSDLSINGKTSETKQQGNFSGVFPEAAALPNPSIQPSHSTPNDPLNGIFNLQTVGMNQSAMRSLGSMYNLSPNVVYNPAFASQSMNHAAMGNYLAQQQQLLATMSNFQHLGHLNSQGNAGLGHSAGNSREGAYASPLPDIFHPNVPVQVSNPMINSSKREETKAFDFISDHLAAARDPKKVI